MSRFSDVPALVILIRHAQKTGIAGDRDLSDLGRQRAEALASNLPRKVERIDRIFAAKTSRKSQRPRLTVEPLAARLGLAIDERWDTGDFAALASKILTSGRYHDEHILICWRHDTLQQLARSLGVHEAPRWGEEIYDRVWSLDYRQGSVQLDEITGVLSQKGA